MGSGREYFLSKAQEIDGKVAAAIDPGVLTSLHEIADAWRQLAERYSDPVIPPPSNDRTDQLAKDLEAIRRCRRGQNDDEPEASSLA